MECTPRTRNGKRLMWDLSPDDIRKIGRGRQWKAIVTDRLTGVAYYVKGASCGSPGCFCDALVVKRVPKEVPA